MTITKMIRLNKYLADCGVASRRKCDQLILQGLISVDDVIIKELGLKIDESRNRVKFKDVALKPPKQYKYFLLNKPRGYVTTASDEKNRKTVLDLIDTGSRIYPVGRLDINTSGLLLLSNDGDLTYKLTHPKHEISKIYEAKLDSSLRPPDQTKLESGIRLEEGLTSKCSIEFPKKTDKRIIRMAIHQGWKRQIRRMFEKLGYDVLELKRIGIAFLTLEGVAVRDSRELTHHEIEKLKAL